MCSLQQHADVAHHVRLSQQAALQRCRQESVVQADDLQPPNTWCRHTVDQGLVSINPGCQADTCFNMAAHRCCAAHKMPAAMLQAAYKHAGDTAALPDLQHPRLHWTGARRHSNRRMLCLLLLLLTMKVYVISTHKTFAISPHPCCPPAAALPPAPPTAAPARRCC